MNVVQNWEKPKVYAVRHLNEEVRAASRSGGIFTALSDVVLAEKGVVYGCVLTEDFQAIHVRAEDAETRDRMRGSKYIQSRMGDTFLQVRKDLQEGRKVLFSGTPCQVAGLKSFLGKANDNLLCVDIVCHGVPSPAVWKKYLEWQEKRNKSKVTEVDFRNKQDFGWKSHIETLKMEKGISISSSVFRVLFYKHSILRPACYECPYKRIKRVGDITIGDYWGIEKAAPEMNDDRGVSLVLVNNDAGEAAFEQVKDLLLWKATRIEDSMQTPLRKSFDRPKEREMFWRDFASRDFEYVARKYGEFGSLAKIRRVLRGVKRRLQKLIRR